MDILFPRFLENVKTHRLISSRDTVIAGFSGGKDSVTLLLLLLELKKDVDFALVAAYLNHNLRPDAVAEEAWVRDFCSQRGIRLETRSVAVERVRIREKMNLEYAASMVRYHFFSELAGRFPHAKIATAHNRTDLVETFFIKLFRGSGLQGLSALYASKEKTIIRPLLIFTQEEILEFLVRRRIAYYHDRSNQDPTFLRNRIRSDLLPAVAKVEPRFAERVFNSVSLLQEDYEFLKDTAGSILAAGLRCGKILPWAILEGRHLCLRRQVVREYLRRLKGNLADITVEHVDALASRPDARGISLPGLNLRFEKGFFFPEKPRLAEYSYAVRGEETVRLVEIGSQVTVKKKSRFAKPKDNYTIVVPAASLIYPLTLRSPQPNDAYQKIHTNHRQAVKEMIREAGFPAPLRSLCPVLVNGDGRLIWVCGSPMADAFTVRSDEQGPYIQISVKPS